MYILSNGSESNLKQKPLRFSSRVSHNPNLFGYMSFWAHDIAINANLVFFFQMMHFFWSRVYDIELLGIFFNSAVFQVMF